MRAGNWAIRVCFVVAGLWLLLAWSEVWSQYRKEVKRVRYVWGPDADTPIFNPLDLVNITKMTDTALIGYAFAVLFLCMGLVCRYLDRRTTRKGYA